MSNEVEKEFMDETVTIERVKSIVNGASNYLEKRIQDMREDSRRSIVAERDALRDSISQLQRIEPRAILGDIQNIKDALMNIRDKINDIEIWKAEKLEKDVRQYNIVHSVEDMQEMYKRSNVTLKELSDKFSAHKSYISKIINKDEGDLVYRHKIYLYMIQEAHKKIKETEDQIISDEVVEKVNA